MSEPTLQDCINYMRSQIKQMEKYPRNYEFNLPYYRKTVELLEKDRRPQGEWLPSILKGTKKDSGAWKCSVCGKSPIFALKSDFCPNCGALMISSNSEIEKSKSEIVPDYRDGWRLREGEKNESRD